MLMDHIKLYRSYVVRQKDKKYISKTRKGNTGFIVFLTRDILHGEFSTLFHYILRDETKCRSVALLWIFNFT